MAPSSELEDWPLLITSYVVFRTDWQGQVSEDAEPSCTGLPISGCPGVEHAGTLLDNMLQVNYYRVLSV